MGRHTCPSDATCVNSQGGYKCTCPAGYKLDETSNRCDGKFGKSFDLKYKQSLIFHFY